MDDEADPPMRLVPNRQSGAAVPQSWGSFQPATHLESNQPPVVFGVPAQQEGENSNSNPNVAIPSFPSHGSGTPTRPVGGGGGGGANRVAAHMDYDPNEDPSIGNVTVSNVTPTRHTNGQIDVLNPGGRTVAVPRRTLFVPTSRPSITGGSSGGGGPAPLPPPVPLPAPIAPPPTLSQSAGGPPGPLPVPTPQRTAPLPVPVVTPNNTKEKEMCDADDNNPTKRLKMEHNVEKAAGDPNDNDSNPTGEGTISNPTASEDDASPAGRPSRPKCNSLVGLLKHQREKAEEKKRKRGEEKRASGGGGGISPPPSGENIVVKSEMPLDSWMRKGGCSPDSDVQSYKPHCLPWNLEEDDILAEYVKQHIQSGSPLPLDLRPISEVLLRAPFWCAKRAASLQEEGVLPGKLPWLTTGDDAHDTALKRGANHPDDKGGVDIDDDIDGLFMINGDAPEIRAQNAANPKRQADLPKDEEIVLSDEQKAVFHMVVEEGKSVFITGGAGCGKSVVLKRIIAHCREKWRSGTLAATASTGIAATPFKGETLSHFSSVVPKYQDVPPEKTALDIANGPGSKFATARWLRCKMLVVDEISMISGAMFNQIDAVARRIRRCPKPFGGVQLVLCGDFLQLPPVQKGNNRKPVDFAFLSDAWKTLDPRNCLLTKPFRQRDNFFLRVLNDVRRGKMSGETQMWLRNNSTNVRDPLKQTELAKQRIAIEKAKQGLGQQQPMQPDENEDAEDDAVRIFPTNATVDAINRKSYSMLTSPQIVYNAWDEKGYPDCLAPVRLELKKGAKVMLLQNLSGTNLANGSIGFVTGFIPADTYVHENNTDKMRNKIFRRIMDKHSHPQNGGVYPVVLFPSSGTKQVILPGHFKEERSDGSTIWDRHQIPLKHAWSMTIHKSQGLSIQKLEVNFEGMFENGHAYVALSRATCPEGLLLYNFEPRYVKTNQVAVSYYEFMECDPKSKCVLTEEMKAHLAFHATTDGKDQRTVEERQIAELKERFERTAQERANARLAEQEVDGSPRTSAFDNLPVPSRRRSEFATPWAVKETKLLESTDPLHNIKSEEEQQPEGAEIGTTTQPQPTTNGSAPNVARSNNSAVMSPTDRVNSTQDKALSRHGSAMDPIDVDETYDDDDENS